jgi:hypothetical protein
VTLTGGPTPGFCQGFSVGALPSRILAREEELFLNLLFFLCGTFSWAGESQKGLADGGD